MNWTDTLNDARYNAYVDTHGVYEPTEKGIMGERFYDEGHELMLVAYYLVVEAWWQVKGWVGEKICWWTGDHRWQDVGSYAGPEGAAEHFYCVRCGAGHHHIYY